VLKQCTKCHKEFNSLSEDAVICRECLDSEFGEAEHVEEEDQTEVDRETRNSSKRQIARARRMSEGYHSNSVFNNSGKLRCCLGIVLFLICVLIFVIGDSDTYRTPINQLDETSQRLFSMSLCVVATGLLLASVRRHKSFILSLSAVMLASGWFMPSFWHYRGPEAGKIQPADKKETKVVEAELKAEPAAPARVLSDDDLAPFRKVEAESPALVHYAVYINDQDMPTRNLVRDAFTRLLQAGYTQAFSRANGALYVVSNVRGERRQISDVLERLGEVTYSRPEQGIYEVRFDPQKANLVSPNSSEELTVPSNPAFVPANLRELSSLDVSRVRQAANNLKSADVGVLRNDIRATLLAVLEESWDAELDAYAALVEALLVYSPAGDTQVLDVCRRYLRTCRALHKGTSPAVIRRLIEEEPDAMVDAVVEQWSSSPIAWNSMLDSLGTRAEERILKLLEETPATNVRMLTNIFQFLQKHGTERSIPALEQHQNHEDQVIRHISEQTVQEIRLRSR